MTAGPHLRRHSPTTFHRCWAQCATTWSLPTEGPKLRCCPHGCVGLWCLRWPSPGRRHDNTHSFTVSCDQPCGAAFHGFSGGKNIASGAESALPGTEFNVLNHAPSFLGKLPFKGGQSSWSVEAWHEFDHNGVFRPGAGHQRSQAPRPNAPPVKSTSPRVAKMVRERDGFFMVMVSEVPRHCRTRAAWSRHRPTFRQVCGPTCCASPWRQSQTRLNNPCEARWVAGTSA